MNVLAEQINIISYCKHSSPEVLQQFAGFRGYTLVADATAAAWAYNPNPGVLIWIANNLSDYGSSQLSTIQTIFATIIRLSSCVSEDVACEPNRLERITELIKYFNTSAASVMTPSHFWEIVSYNLPIQPFIHFLFEKSFEVGLEPTIQESMWLWTAAWENANHELVAWLTPILNIKLGSMPDFLKTICIFRKPLSNEIVQSIPSSHIPLLIKTIAADMSVHNISIEVVGGYRAVQLQWELPNRPRYALRNRDATHDFEDAYQLRQHVEHTSWYTTPAASIKLLWLGIPPSFEEHLNIALETIDSIGCTFFAVDGYRNDTSSDDSNKLITTAIMYADKALSDCFHKRTMMKKLLKPLKP